MSEYTGRWDGDKKCGKGTYRCKEYTITGIF